MHYMFLNIHEHNNSSYTGAFTTSSGKKYTCNKYKTLKNIHLENKMFYAYESAVDIAAISIFL